MSRIRRSAQGKPCQLRVPGVCNGDWSTTVHAHVRRAGVGGMGLKPPDLCGVRACHACHDWLDRRNQSDDELRDTYILEGMIRTIDALLSEGVVDP
jgi:hypothetical protein